MIAPTKEQIKDFLEVFKFVSEAEAWSRVRILGYDRCNTPEIIEKAEKVEPVLKWLRGLAKD